MSDQPVVPYTPQQLASLNFFQKYGKSIAAFLFVLYTAFVPLWTGDHHLNRDELIIFALAICNNIVTWIIPLTPRFKSIKSVVFAFLAALAAAQTVLIDGWQANDLVLIIGAALASLGVYIAPAASLKEITPVVVTTGSDAN